MNNKPKYHLFKNASYAIDGFKDLISTETSFKLEVIYLLIATIGIFFIEIETYQKLLIIGSIIFILIVETINSAIERVVDLVTKDYHMLAKQAKDACSFAVMLSIFIHLIILGFVFGII